MLALAVTVFLTFTYFLSTSSQGTVISDRIPGAEFKGGDAVAVDQDLSPGVLSGGAIAPKLENATAKYVDHRRPSLHDPKAHDPLSSDA
jgi:hypothetical protein